MRAAAHASSIQSAKRAIHNGDDIDSLDHNGQTPLHLACSRHNLELVDLLLKLGVRRDMPVSAGITPNGFTKSIISCCAEESSGKEEHVSTSCRCLCNQSANFKNALRRNFPAGIVETMMQKKQVTAVVKPAVSILFLEILGFAGLRGSMNPVKIVRLLERLFHAFDALAAHHCVECVDTFDGCYIAAANYSIPQPTDHAARLASFALAAIRIAALTEIDAERPELGSARLLAGMHCGSVCGSVVGVHGGRKHTLHGAAVNIASRMQSHGAPGVVQCSAAAAALIETQGESRGLQVTRRGEEVDVKGVGRMRTFWLTAGASSDPQTGDDDARRPRSCPACLVRSIRTDNSYR